MGVKHPVSGRHKGDWGGRLSHAVFIDPQGAESIGFILEVDKAPDGDSLMKKSALAGNPLALAKWPDIGSGDNDRQFMIFSQDESEQGTRVVINGEALIGQLVSKEKMPLSMKGEERGRLEFILRVKSLRKENQ